MGLVENQSVQTYGSFRLYLTRQRGWRNSGHSFALGTAFLGSEKYSAQALAEKIEDLSDIDEVVSLVRSLNGFFALVRKFPKGLVAFVDRIRGFPLFYGVTHENVFLSDDAQWVRGQVGDSEVDPVAREEFSLTGYVTGEDTLFPNVKQLQAGECLIASGGLERPRLRTDRYYTFWHSEPTQGASEDQLKRELHEVMRRAIDRLVAYADGRQLIIPLSGGYDSRLIALLLRESGYENVLTFSYGLPGNREAQISRSVARVLEFPWTFVPYSKAKWREWHQSEERYRYACYGSSWASLPHMQDWPAVKMIKASKKASSDGIFVPGHTGDFICGGHIPNALRTQQRVSGMELAKLIFLKHYRLIRADDSEQTTQERLLERILDRVEAESVSTSIEAANAFEKWEWQERQAKFIVNSVRVYEFWGYDWWCPFWDLEVMEFWEDVPLSQRTGDLYRQYVDDRWSHYTGTSLQTTLDIGNQMHARVSKFLTLRNRKYIGKWLDRAIVARNSLRSPLGLVGRFPLPWTMWLLSRGYTSNGIGAHDFLSSLPRLVTLAGEQLSNRKPIQSSDERGQNWLE